MACLKARTANTGAGVSGGSKLPVVSGSVSRQRSGHWRKARQIVITCVLLLGTGQPVKHVGLLPTRSATASSVSAERNDGMRDQVVFAIVVQSKKPDQPSIHRRDWLQCLHGFITNSLRKVASWSVHSLALPR